jgi:hypothetical protein
MKRPQLLFTGVGVTNVSFVLLVVYTAYRRCQLWLTLLSAREREIRGGSRSAFKSKVWQMLAKWSVVFAVFQAILQIEETQPTFAISLSADATGPH